MADLFRNKYRIPSTRLPGYDYSSPGKYFITICENNKTPVFGKIQSGTMFLNEFGIIARDCWADIPNHFPVVTLDEYCVMPDHVHGIVCINDNANNHDAIMDATVFPVETQNFASLHTHPDRHGIPKPHSTGNTFGPQSMNLASIIRGFKIGVTKYARQNKIPFQWQPRFYDSIIRDQKSLFNIRQYIRNNPKQWKNKEKIR